MALYWTSPVVITGTNAAQIQTSQTGTLAVAATTLLQSSPNAWLSSDTNIQPDFDRYPGSGFQRRRAAGGTAAGRKPAGGVWQLFCGQAKPAGGRRAPAPGPGGSAPISATPAKTASAPIVTPLLQAADSARLVVVGSSEFVDDAVLQMASSLAGEQVLNNVQFVQNAVDWAAEDTDLLSLRSRGPAAHLLEPLGEAQQQFWELLTYFLVLAGLVAAGAAVYAWRRRERPMPLTERDAYVKASIIG